MNLWDSGQKKVVEGKKVQIQLSYWSFSRNSGLSYIATCTVKETTMCNW